MKSGKRVIRVAALQMASLSEDKAGNLKKAAELLQGEPWDLAVLPELFATEFFATVKDPALFRLAEPIQGTIVTEMAKVAKKMKGYLVVPFFERGEADICYNSAAFVGREGQVLGVYRKTHIPFTRTYEKYYFSPGGQFPVFETDFGKVGVLICYDRWYPEAWRKLILQGAEIVCIPISSWKFQGFSEISMWKPLLQIRARENLAYAAAANRVGKEGEFFYIGRSLVANPRGEVVGELGETEERLLTVSCDLEMVREERAALPFLRDRRPELYDC